MRPLLLALLMATLFAPGCGGSNTAPSIDAPGKGETATTKALDLGAGLLQSKPPIEAIDAYLDGFHFYSGDQQSQMEAHHYCSVVNDEVFQCVIYDGNSEEAKLMGVEYIVSERLFQGLPAAEKALWHSHVHEVKSGQLIAPGIPEAAESELMKKLVSTYGKTWHTWHTSSALRAWLPRRHRLRTQWWSWRLYSASGRGCDRLHMRTDAAACQTHSRGRRARGAPSGWAIELSGSPLFAAAPAALFGMRPLRV